MNIPDSKLSSLDELDFAILSHLREDGRKSFTELANALDVSVGTIRNRYARLVEDNVLQVYGRVNPEQVGVILYAQIFIVVRPSEHIESILYELAQYPEVSFLALVTGEYDIEVNVMCRNNEHLYSLVNEKIHKLEGVYFTRTNLYLRLLKTAQPDLSQFFLPGK
jgi:Lrp/AsnC family transcriptional regulator for asnA, asnC and gidA